MTTELPLPGGRSTEGVVRIKDTVHRPQGENSPFVHSLLQFLGTKDFKYVPRFLGIDEKDREILTFVEGEVPHDETHWTDEMLVETAHILRKFHDSTFGSELAGEHEVVCHNDFAPWNIVLKESRPVAVIDFDGASPGSRSDEVAYMLWTFINLGESIDLEEQIRKVKLMCDAYDFHEGKELVDSLLNQQEKVLAMREDLAKNGKTEEVRDFSAERIPQIHSQIEWAKTNREVLENTVQS